MVHKCSLCLLITTLFFSCSNEFNPEFKNVYVTKRGYRIQSEQIKRFEEKCVREEFTEKIKMEIGTLKDLINEKNPKVLKINQSKDYFEGFIKTPTENDKTFLNTRNWVFLGIYSNYKVCESRLKQSMSEYYQYIKMDTKVLLRTGLSLSPSKTFYISEVRGSDLDDVGIKQCESVLSYKNLKKRLVDLDGCQFDPGHFYTIFCDKPEELAITIFFDKSSCNSFHTRPLN